MYAKIYSSCLIGMEGQVIEVELNVHAGLPSFILIGLPSSTVRESAERIRTGIQNSKFEYPMRRITVNLAPSEIRKEGSTIDLAMSVALLISTKQIELPELESTLFIGEVALDGTIRRVSGVLSMVEDAKKRGFKRVIVPEENVGEALLIQGLEVYPIRSLHDLRNELSPSLLTKNTFTQAVWEIKSFGNQHGDYSACIGQTHAIRALTIAVTGNHHILFNGPPGSGKTMMMRLMPTIMPPLTNEQAIEVTKVYSIAEHYPGGLVQQRPMRAPHHTTTIAGLIGGGFKMKPGELSMAHHGVIFLDEFTEFPKHVLETLRQPLEEQRIVLSRAKQTLVYPSNVLLAAAMNPCPCGYHGYSNPSKKCGCTSSMVNKYQSKLSGPLLDRIDIVVSVPEVNLSTYKSLKPTPSSAELREQIKQAIAFRNQRNNHNEIIHEKAEKYIQEAFEKLGISMRARASILRVARTIADLDQSEEVNDYHLSEAIGYRNTILHKAMNQQTYG